MKIFFIPSLPSRTASVPSVGLEDIARALLGQVVHGFEGETLENADLVRLGGEGVSE